jgi:hypothetical protein
LILLQTDERTTRKAIDISEIVPQPGQMRPAVASELRTVEYTFTRPTGEPPNERQHPTGLLRREWAWEQWIGMKLASIKPTSDDSSYADMMPDPLAEWTEEDAIAFETGHDLLHVPQVSGLEFYYYDGTNWELDWNSWERNALPQLIEVLIQIKINKEDPTREDDEEEVEDEETSLADSENSSYGGASDRSSNHGVVYRKLIQLSFAPPLPASDLRQRASGIDELAGTSTQVRAKQP